jgi:hypothetical protein
VIENTAVKEQELKRLKTWLMKLLPDAHDKFDLDAEFDSSLSYQENKNIIREKVKHFLKTDFKDISKAQAQQAIDEQEKLDKERDTQIEKEITEYNKVAAAPNKKIDGFYADITRAVNKVSQGFSGLAFVKGRGGIGKSTQIKKTLVANEADFVEICGDVSEAYLYRLFYEYNGRVIWFKDVAKLLKGLKSINLLKSASETEAMRLLTKSNYSRDQSDLPDRFIWKGRIIFDYNSLEGLQLKDDFEALVTRGDYVELSLSEDDIKTIMLEIAGVDSKLMETTKFLIDEYSFRGYELLNLRMQYKAVKTREYAEKNKLDWKDEVKNELTANDSRIRKVLYSYMGTKAYRTGDLKRILLRAGVVNSVRTADRRIVEWILLEEIFKVSEEDKDYFVCLYPVKRPSTSFEKA